MQTTVSVLAATLLAAGLGAQAPTCAFVVGVVPGRVQFELKTEAPALGAIVLSQSPKAVEMLPEVLPILAYPTVLVVVPFDSLLIATTPTLPFPAGVPFYAQGIVANETGVSASPIDEFVVIDGMKY